MFLEMLLNQQRTIVFSSLLDNSCSFSSQIFCTFTDKWSNSIVCSEFKKNTEFNFITKQNIIISRAILNDTRVKRQKISDFTVINYGLIRESWEI